MYLLISLKLHLSDYFQDVVIQQFGKKKKLFMKSKKN